MIIVIVMVLAPSQQAVWVSAEDFNFSRGKTLTPLPLYNCPHAKVVGRVAMATAVLYAKSAFQILYPSEKVAGWNVMSFFSQHFCVKVIRQKALLPGVKIFMTTY